MKPLDTVTIVDMGHVTAGPLASWLLQPFGADVIKVERPGTGEGGRDVVSPSESDDSAGYYFHSKNADKQSVSVNVKEKAGCDVVRRLAREADVFVENFVPGKLESLGLGYKDLRAENESLVYCSVSGFGHDSIDQGRRAYDSILQALSGIMYVTGYEDDPPTKLGPSVMDNLAGYVAATAILAALHHRSETGDGQYVDVSMQDSAAWLMQSRLPFNDERTRHRPARDPHTMSGVFETRDGWVAVDARRERDRDRLAQRLGEDVNDASFESTFTAWTIDQFTADVIVECMAVDVSATPVRDIAAVATDDHLHKRGTFEMVECWDGTRMLPLSPYRTAMPDDSKSPDTGGPSLGEHTEEVLTDVLGYDEKTIRELREESVIE